MKRKQLGISLIGFVLVLAVVGFAALVGMKLFPMYSEYYAVKKSLKAIAAEPGIADRDPSQIKDMFFRRMDVNYSDNVKPEHVKVERDPSTGALTIKVDYEVRKPLVYNLDVVGHFQADEALVNRG